MFHNLYSTRDGSLLGCPDTLLGFGARHDDADVEVVHGLRWLIAVASTIQLGRAPLQGFEGNPAGVRWYAACQNIVAHLRYSVCVSLGALRCRARVSVTPCARCILPYHPMKLLSKQSKSGACRGQRLA